MLRPYKGTMPKLGSRVYVDVSAQVIGDVELGDHSSVWMNAVVRGDVHSIRIGPYTNIQDNCVVHVFKDKHPTVLADHVTVGHSVTLHGCRIDSWCLIGMGAIVLNGARIGKNSLVGAGALVTEGKSFPDNSLIVGSPARAIRSLDEKAVAQIRHGAEHYVRRSREYAKGLKRVG
jgi:carbonic anhydrase/acetyltransferase-like protein (isoleucine patch superfamily)